VLPPPLRAVDETGSGPAVCRGRGGRARAGSLQPPRRRSPPLPTAFKGDAHALAASRAELRSKFAEGAAVADPADVARRVADAREAADFLRTYVVQAALNERGNYRMTVQPHQADTVADEGALRGPKGGGKGGARKKE